MSICFPGGLIVNGNQLTIVIFIVEMEVLQTARIVKVMSVLEQFAFEKLEVDILCCFSS